MLFSLDPTIQDKGYVVLTDDENLQANGNFIPVVREEVASEELGALLDGVTTTLTDENMREMVGQILNDKRDVADVAEEYLTNAGILRRRSARAGARPRPSVLTNPGCPARP